MNDRQKALMQLLLTRSDEFVHVQTLADELGCSHKTIRNDLNRLEKNFAAYSTLEFVRKPGAGVSLVIGDEEKAQLFHWLYQTSESWEHEQIIEITYYLLINQKPVTLNELAQKYYTNKTTVKRYLDEIASWLWDYNLQLVSKQRVGSVVQGNELNKRNALARLSELGTSQTEQTVDVVHLFPEHEINTVRKALRDLQKQFSFSLNTGEFESLLMHALIMIKRTRQQSPVSIEHDAGNGRDVSMAAYHMTAWLLNQLEKTLKLTFPENEHVYYTWHLESTQQLPLSAKKSENRLVTQVVDAMMRKIRHMTMMDFHKDKVLTDGLTIHLESALTRLKHGLTIRNPMLEDIKKHYPYMFSMVVFAVEDINDAFDVTISEHEAAYLVLHFQASVERMQQKQTDRHRAVIVCELGVGMSSLLQAKLEQQYSNLDIIASVSREDILKNTYDADLIISTIEVPESHLPVIVVSPLLEADDKKRLNQWLYQTDEGTGHTQENIKVLRQLLREDASFADIQQTHRLEVVETMAERLVDKGYTDQAFVHSALMRERSSSTAIGGGIAIPHARPDLVRASVVAAAVLPAPLSWGNEQVSIVFFLAIAEQDAHLIKPLMQAILTISQQPETVQQLRHVQGLSDILKVLE